MKSVSAKESIWSPAKTKFKFFLTILRQFREVSSLNKFPNLFFLLAILCTCFSEVPKSPVIMPFKGSKIVKY